MPEPFSIGVAGYTMAIYLAARPSSAVSREADVLRESVCEIIESAERSVALYGARTSLMSEIFAIAEECGADGWDAGDGSAIGSAVVDAAIAFIRVLPLDLPLPEGAAEPGGSISLDWIASRTRVFSLSIGATNRLAFAWIDGTDRGHGVARFDGDAIPSRILSGIREIMNDRIPALRTA